MIEALGLLAASQIPLEVPSGLAPQDHEHEWVEFFREPANLAFFDAAFESVERIGDDEYPVALVRYLKAEANFEVAVTDFRIAIDCDGRAMAAFAVWSPPEEQGLEEQGPGQFAEIEPEFEHIAPANEARVAGLFRHICGPDWASGQ